MREIQCKRCFFFTPEWCPKKRDSLDPDLIRDCQYFRTKTNADHIRSMTDEELCKLLIKICHHPCIAKSGDCGRVECKECWLDWLKEEYKNE